MATNAALILQTTAQMFDRMAQRKAQRNIDALNQMKLGMQDRRLTMMEESADLQAEAFETQKFYNQLQNVEKLTKSQAADVSNQFLLMTRFNEFYNPDDDNWAEDFRKILKGEYKTGYTAKSKVGFGFSDRNASLILNTVVQASASKNPNAILNLVNRVDRAHRMINSGQLPSAQDRDLLQGFVNMGMFTKDDKSVIPTQDMSSMMSATDNILSNLSKLSKEISEITEEKIPAIESKFNFLQYNQLPAITSTEAEVTSAEANLQKLVDLFRAGGDEEIVKTPVQEANENIISLSNQIDNKEEQIALDKSKFQNMKIAKTQGLTIDEVEMANLAESIANNSASKDSLFFTKRDVEREKDLSIKKQELIDIGVQPTEENIQQRERIRPQQIDQAAEELATFRERYRAQQ